MLWPQCFLKKCPRWIEWEHSAGEEGFEEARPQTWYEYHLLCTPKASPLFIRHLCVFIHVCACVCHVCMLTFLCVYAYIHVWVSCVLYLWMRMCVCVCMCTCLCVLLCVHANVCSCVYLCMHVCEGCIMGVFICLSHLLIRKLSEAWEWCLLLCISLVSWKAPSSAHTCRCMLTECICCYWSSPCLTSESLISGNDKGRDARSFVEERVRQMSYGPLMNNLEKKSIQWVKMPHRTSETHQM